MVHDRIARGVVRQVALFAWALWMAACHYQRYQSAPLDPAQQAAVHARRRLDDPALTAFLLERGAQRPDSGLTPTALALAATYFRPELAEARASLVASRAAAITAGVRPYPSATATVQHSSPLKGGDDSPWTISLSTGLTFETGGKRSARQARARAFTLATGLRLDAAAWRLGQEARLAAVAALGAERDLADAEGEVAALRTVLELLRARYAEGRISLADIAQAETDVQTSVVAVTQARRGRTSARVHLARSLGVPFRRVDTLPLLAEHRSACDVSDSLAAGRAGVETTALESMALRQRYDVGVSLADYAVAETNLRVAIAQQYPDLTIGPGISWDQGIVRWVLSAGSAAIPVTRNRGPIAEADARRAVQAAHVAVAQDSVLAQVDSASAGCRDLRGEIAAADSLVAATAERLRLTDAAYVRGEIGRTEVAFARLALVRATRIQRQALQRRQAAGAALEAAVGRWFTVPDVRWPEMHEPLARENSSDRSPTENDK